LKSEKRLAPGLSKQIPTIFFSQWSFLPRKNFDLRSLHQSLLMT
jgi:hypothetical protein